MRLPEPLSARRRPLRPAGSRRAGFSLAELMVVIVILGLLATLVVPNVMKRLSTAMGGKAKADIAAIAQALEECAISNGGKYPESLEALVEPHENGNTFLKGRKVPLDPWKNEYGYEPPMPGQNRPRVFTLGKDGMVGGEGDDSDLDNWMIEDGEA
jgi:general secretion pathway protein G